VLLAPADEGELIRHGRCQAQHHAGLGQSSDAQDTADYRASILDASVDVANENVDVPDVRITTCDSGLQSDSRHSINKPSTSDLDLNMIGTSGFNCLHAAASSGNIEMTEYLLFKRKVNPNILGKDNWSPLEIAVQSEILEIVQLFLQDERLNLKGFSGRRGSPLHLAAKNGNFKIANLLLLKAPSLIAIKDEQGMTPKDLASNKRLAEHLNKYWQAHTQSDSMTLLYDDTPLKHLEKVAGNTGMLDQIAELEEEDVDFENSLVQSSKVNLIGSQASVGD